LMDTKKRPGGRRPKAGRGSGRWRKPKLSA
jgi:hypothetical protein